MSSIVVKTIQLAMRQSNEQMEEKDRMIENLKELLLAKEDMNKVTEERNKRKQTQN